MVMELNYVKLKEVKPALAGYIIDTKALLKGSVVPGEKVIHDVRVLMKKSRAVMRLVGPQLGNDFFTRDILAFREVGRIMCSWRDTSVHRKILKELSKENPGIFSRLKENEKINALLMKNLTDHEHSEEIQVGLKKIDDLLNIAGHRIRFQSMDKLDPQQLIKDLELTYLSVMHIYLTCRNNPKPENIHEFRKKAKKFFYQLYFFRPLNPSVVKSIEKKLDIMTRNLGKYNDYTQLVKALGYKCHDSNNLPAMDELIMIIRDEQDKCLSKVWPVAYKIFCPGQNLVNVLGFKILVI